jgi:excisionase family DNA binding protein
MQFDKERFMRQWAALAYTIATNAPAGVPPHVEFETLCLLDITTVEAIDLVTWHMYKYYILVIFNNCKGAEMTIEWFDVDRLADIIADKVAERVSIRPGPDKLLTVKELAEALQVPKSWVYDRTRIKEGGIPRYKVGKYVRFDLGDVLKWIKENDDAGWMQMLAFRNLLPLTEWRAA